MTRTLFVSLLLLGVLGCGGPLSRADLIREGIIPAVQTTQMVPAGECRYDAATRTYYLPGTFAPPSAVSYPMQTITVSGGGGMAIGPPDNYYDYLQPVPGPPAPFVVDPTPPRYSVYDGYGEYQGTVTQFPNGDIRFYH